MSTDDENPNFKGGIQERGLIMDAAAAMGEKQFPKAPLLTLTIARLNKMS
ncbi:hypothetical protein ACFLZR_00505 [Candidatus Neomarinimicrobiota bacterium]